MKPTGSRRIVFTVYEGVSLLDLAGPLEAFRVADAWSSAIEPPGSSRRPGGNCQGQAKAECRNPAPLCNLRRTGEYPPARLLLPGGEGGSAVTQETLSEEVDKVSAERFSERFERQVRGQQVRDSIAPIRDNRES
jgi:hypothetical protein